MSAPGSTSPAAATASRIPTPGLTCSRARSRSRAGCIRSRSSGSRRVTALPVRSRREQHQPHQHDDGLRGAARRHAVRARAGDVLSRRRRFCRAAAQSLREPELGETIRPLLRAFRRGAVAGRQVEPEGLDRCSGPRGALNKSSRGPEGAAAISRIASPPRRLAMTYAEFP